MRKSILALCAAMTLFSGCSSQDDSNLADEGDQGVLDSLLPELEEDYSITGSLKTIVATSVTVGGAWFSLTEDKKFISMSFSIDENDPEFMDKIKRTLQSMHDANPGAKIKHGFPSREFLSAQGKSTELLDVIDSIWKPSEQVRFFPADITEAQWKRMSKDEIDFIMSDMRNKWAEGIKNGGSQTHYIVGKQSLEAKGVIEEQRHLNRGNHPYVVLNDVGDEIHLDPAAVRANKIKNMRSLFRKGTKFVALVSGVYVIGKESLRAASRVRQYFNNSALVNDDMLKALEEHGLR